MYPRIELPRVGINLALVPGDGRTPPAVAEAFVYPGPRPGNTYIYAHARAGIFWGLHNVRLGDAVLIDYGHGERQRYRVSQIVPSVDPRNLSYLRPATDNRLTLQTCNGWTDLDPRFIVIAEPIASA